MRILANCVLAGTAFAQPCIPPAPTAVGCAPQPCAVEISWASSPSLSAFEVFRREPGQGEVRIGVAYSQRYFDISAPAGGAFYSVRALGDCGAGPRSVEVFCQPQAGSLVPRTGLGANSSYGCEYLLLVWNAPYPYMSRPLVRIWRGPDADFGRAEVVGTAYDSGRFYDLTAVPGVPYWYWVDGVLGPCTSPLTGPIVGQVYALTREPSDLVATDGTFCQGVLVNWRGLECETGAEVWRGSSPDIADAVHIGGTRPFLDTSAEDGAVYWYWVRTVTTRQTGPFAGPVRGVRNDAAAPTVVVPPEAMASPGGFGAMEARVEGARPESLSFQWRHEGVPLVDDERIGGSRTGQLYINGVRESDRGNYDVVVTSPCGTSISDPIDFTIDYVGCPAQVADWNLDGGVDGWDVEAFFVDWESGEFCSDVTLDGGIDGADVVWFFTCWE